jgi:hypothetical protein
MQERILERQSREIFLRIEILERLGCGNFRRGPWTISRFVLRADA